MVRVEHGQLTAADQRDASGQRLPDVDAAIRVRWVALALSERDVEVHGIEVVGQIASSAPINDLT